MRSSRRPWPHRACCGRWAHAASTWPQPRPSPRTLLDTGKPATPGSSAPDAIVLGDLHRGFTWQRLNDLFTQISAGAALIALHKNRVARRGGDIALDLGPFVAALEYAADIEATVVGKPSRQFFDLAVASADVAPEEVLMVGDDIEADIGGALGAGLKAVQVRTGKYRSRDDDHPRSQPQGRIDTITDLAAWLTGVEAQWAIESRHHTVGVSPGGVPASRPPLPWRRSPASGHVGGPCPDPAR